MGKTGTVINIEEGKAVVKLDKDGKAYQEVEVQLDTLAKAIETDCNGKCAKDKGKSAMNEEEGVRTAVKVKTRYMFDIFVTIFLWCLKCTTASTVFSLYLSVIA